MLDTIRIAKNRKESHKTCVTDLGLGLEENLELLDVTSAAQKDRASLMDAGRHNIQNWAFMSDCTPASMLNKKSHWISLQHHPETARSTGH